MELNNNQLSGLVVGIGVGGTIGAGSHVYSLLNPIHSSKYRAFVHIAKDGVDFSKGWHIIQQDSAHVEFQHQLTGWKFKEAVSLQTPAANGTKLTIANFGTGIYQGVQTRIHNKIQTFLEDYTKIPAFKKLLHKLGQPHIGALIITTTAIIGFVLGSKSTETK